MNLILEEKIQLLKNLLPGGVSFQLTNTMLVKSTIDASKTIRDFLVNNSFFDFDQLLKGQKEYMNCQLFDNGNLFQRKVSLVRPQAKPDRPGDPRIWIYDLNKNVKSEDWIYFGAKDDIFYVIPVKTDRKFTGNVERVFGEKLNYVVSSGLKNLIGKQLITDEFIAIFELVKNSFDAHARNVVVIFENLKGSNPKIIIKDDGKGMNFNELKNKWLFVGYSAKSDGSEDEDYRHNLGVKRVYAGAKGVGRFSCDRLGSTLKLTTRKDDKNSLTEVLHTNWRKFEEDPKARFEDIGVTHETLQIDDSDNMMSHGTILEISDIDKNWTRKKLLALKLSLEKLILPESRGSKLKDKKRKEFKINLITKSEAEEDGKYTDSIKDYYNIVNGQIRNLIFETLELKTASIGVSISEDGEEITTSLNDKGLDIYRITEKNPYDLQNIDINLYHLNQSAKLTFSRRMGFPIMRYGHVFVYKNGFRIYPFGDFEEDHFAVDLRKSDKEFSRIGTRSLSGRIEINGDVENNKFIELTSRDSGFVKNNSFKELKTLYHNTIGRFEKYVVDVVKWGKDIEFTNLSSGERNEEVIQLISDISGSDSIIKIWYNDKIVDILSTKQEASASALLVNLQKAAEKTGEKSVFQDVTIAQQRLAELKIVTEQAEQIARDAKISVDEARKALEFERQKNKYLLSADKNISDDIRSMLHNYKNVTNKINTNIEILTLKIKNDELDKSELLDRLAAIKFSTDKAYKMSRLMTKADFRTNQERNTVEIVDYFDEYINDYNSLFEDRKLKIEINRKGEKFFRKVSLLDLSIVIDNLIANSGKKGANKIRLDFNTTTSNQLDLIFSDNGEGLSTEFLKDPDVIFELGITDTDGSGIGLNSVRNILKDNNASILFLGNKKVLQGASFQLTFK